MLCVTRLETTSKTDVATMPQRRAMTLLGDERPKTKVGTSWNGPECAGTPASSVTGHNRCTAQTVIDYRWRMALGWGCRRDKWWLLSLAAGALEINSEMNSSTRNLSPQTSAVHRLCWGEMATSSLSSHHSVVVVFFIINVNNRTFNLVVCTSDWHGSPDLKTVFVV